MSNEAFEVTFQSNVRRIFCRHHTRNENFYNSIKMLLKSNICETARLTFEKKIGLIIYQVEKSCNNNNSNNNNSNIIHTHMILIMP